MKRIKMIIAYDGTNYCGWQKQDNAITVEGVINDRLEQLTGEKIQIIGASRTDSGVHAFGNVAVFDTESRIEATKFAPALNARLPEDIRIMSSLEVSADFHPRYCKSSKIYEYKILNSKTNIPIYRLYTNYVYYSLDMARMKRAAEYFVGEHDFSAFCSANSQVEDKVRNILSIDVTKDKDIITIRVQGNGFLYNMVRIIAGTLIEVGRGRIEPDMVREIIESRDRSKAGPTALAHGLTLVEILY